VVAVPGGPPAGAPRAGLGLLLPFVSEIKRFALLGNAFVNIGRGAVLGVLVEAPTGTLNDVEGVSAMLPGPSEELSRFRPDGSIFPS
jgi:hypothetical protein